MAAKASELCGEVRGLRDRLLSVLEKPDGEGFAALARASPQVTLTER